jgi:hypothetical protein
MHKFRGEWFKIYNAVCNLLGKINFPVTDIEEWFKWMEFCKFVTLVQFSVNPFCIDNTLNIFLNG